MKNLCVCEMGEILHGRVDLKGLIVNSPDQSPEDLDEFHTGPTPVTLFGPATPVTLFGAATSGGKKADKRLLFGTESDAGDSAQNAELGSQTNRATTHCAKHQLPLSFGQNTLGHF